MFLNYLRWFMKEMCEVWKCSLSLSLSLSLSKCLTFHPLESPFLSWLKLGRLNKCANKKKWIQLLSSGQDTNTCSVLDMCSQSNVFSGTSHWTKAKSKKNRPKNLKLCNTGFKCFGFLKCCLALYPLVIKVFNLYLVLNLYYFLINFWGKHEFWYKF